MEKVRQQITMRETVGTFTGTVATVTLGEVNLIIGIIAALVTIICLLPSGFIKTRELFEKYEFFKLDYIGPRRFLFLRYVFGKLPRSPKDSPGQIRFDFPARESRKQRRKREARERTEQ